LFTTKKRRSERWGRRKVTRNVVDREAIESTSGGGGSGGGGGGGGGGDGGGGGGGGGGGKLFKSMVRVRVQ
jgi:hypothetical protein